jgi:hypothetical protein
MRPTPKDKPYARTFAAAINRPGWIAGTVIYHGKMHGFLRRRNGTFIAVDVPGASQTSVFAINAYDEVDAPGCGCGPLRAAAGNYTQLAVPGADTTQALGINGTAVVVGTEHDSVSYHGFLWGTQNGSLCLRCPEPSRAIRLRGPSTGLGSYRLLR